MPTPVSSTNPSVSDDESDSAGQAAPYGGALGNG